MRRLSSRQRMSRQKDCSSHEVSEYSFLKSKRAARRSKQDEASLASTRDDSMGSSKTYSNECPSLSSLGEDIHLQILEFCDVSSIRSMMQVNHRYRNLMTATPASKNLWKDVYHRRWSWLLPTTELVDELSLPTAASSKSSINLSLLLSLASKNKPTTPDESIFAPCHWNRILHQFLPLRRPVELQTLQVNETLKAVQYTGPVGRGDRCIRANQPLPRPGCSERKRSIRSFLRQKPFTWKPFVAPFRGSVDTVYVTPRLVSYFEITLLAPPNNTPRVRTTAGESVGIGVATEDFALHGSMPGWDTCSYGYHGDDGGVYHEVGKPLRTVGPVFGAGDTVGCGVDYVQRAIFFTHNGKFLEYAFDMSMKELQRQDFYPVVGMDTNCPVVCNFGCDKPFLFDLNGMVQQQREIILKCLNVPCVSK
jgi:hypothetical protein